jgi:hypothetical protein
MCLQVFLLRNGDATGGKLHHVHDIERNAGYLRQRPGEGRLSAAGIPEDGDLLHATLPTAPQRSRPTAWRRECAIVASFGV